MRNIAIVGMLLGCAHSFAHDTWVETNTNLVRTGDAVFVDLKLGNHGNTHRDFKLASKVDLESCELKVIAPDGTAYDLKDRLIDVGYAPKEGYWTTKFAVAKPGMYVVSHSLDAVVNHGRPTRSIKSGKTCFVVSDSLDRVPFINPGFDRPAGHAFEILPVANPVTPMGPGEPIVVRVLLEGQPLADTTVSFIPQSETLRDGFDERYERKTNAAGEAEFTPKTGDRYLVVAHHTTDDSGDGYEQTAYAATLTVFVPEMCPCCE
ncbi:MAG: DUF4198 domain-containing protein [Planctomycetota bacterium]|nr:DUF4198 domain-containing protein [Planctomycetaceae bacterium]MDQ3331362.1 DUF4198 domain-containing protein [Planctomycetota bacterium]